MIPPNKKTLLLLFATVFLVSFSLLRFTVLQRLEKATLAIAVVVILLLAAFFLSLLLRARSYILDLDKKCKEYEKIIKESQEKRSYLEKENSQLAFICKDLEDKANKQTNNLGDLFGWKRLPQTLSEKPLTTFRDIAGYKHTKNEVIEIINFIRNPREFENLGITVPNNLLLIGPSGTGKTMLARAVANSLDVPFFYASGTEFMEVYIGLGASRVRSLFTEAKKCSPSIVFIDEVDAIANKRSESTINSNIERDQTLNELLVQLDGFHQKDSSKIIFIAATNREAVLDPSFTQRIKRHILVPLPNQSDRREILFKYINKKLFELDDTSINEIADTTNGFSGRELENLINESVIQTTRRLKEIAKRSVRSIQNPSCFSVALPVCNDTVKNPVQFAGIGVANDKINIKLDSANFDVLCDEEGFWVTLIHLKPGIHIAHVSLSSNQHNHNGEKDLIFTVLNAREHMSKLDIDTALFRMNRN